MNRRRFIKIVTGAVGVSAAAGVATPLYAHYVEPYWLSVEKHKLHFPDVSKPPVGLRIIQLSDIHRSGIVPDSYIIRCVSEVNSLKPNMVVLTGDYITLSRKWADGLNNVLKPLTAKLGVYACLGNHDGGNWAGFGTSSIKEELEKAGIQVLVNERVNLVWHGREFSLVGLGDLLARQFAPQTVLKGTSEDQFTIALSHNPDTLRQLEEYHANLILCGHTHGGQVNIPLIGPPILPVEDKQYSAGFYKLGDKLVYVNRGVGLLKKVRFNCRPEIACFDVM